MHHVRGLVRRASRRALQSMEAQHITVPSSQACVRSVQLQDVDGQVARVPLLHAGALLKLVEPMTADEALHTLEEVGRLLEPATPPDTEVSTHLSMESATSSPLQSLYVKDACTSVTAELQRRQRRFLAKVRGRFLASDAAAAEQALQQWLTHTSPTALADTAVAEYRGMVESLTSTDAAAAVALAINPALPSLTGGASAALAGIVQLQTPAAVHAFLESFATKDELTLASETCATHLAARLRKERAQDTGYSHTTTPQLLKEAMHFAVDPAVVFPSDPAAIQAWADQFLSSSMLPTERAAGVFQQVRQRRLLPRRVSMDALSVWTLTDLERPWLKRALASGSTGYAAEEADEMLHNAAYQLAVRDARRNLIDNRLLDTYAAALARGDVSPLDDSFASFLEECGECHASCSESEERPRRFSFTLPGVPDGVSVLRALHDLAPQCSYWRTLLDHSAANHVTVRTAPMGELKVEVQLPSAHECVTAAEQSLLPLPRVPVLYEDKDVLVVDKPAGLATSRHGLSCTQLGSPTTDLISVLLATTFKDVRETMTNVFRQGQVHRLDAETSGCLLIAKSDTAADSLRHQMGTSAAFSHQSKVYHALCVVLEPSLHNVKLHDDIADAADPKTRTRYRVIRFFPTHRIAWVECRIQQGKKHQIRRHLASRGFPILADVEHGGAACCQPMIDRIALHAHAVSFIHPVTADVIQIVSPLPADFQRCLAQLERQ